MSDDQGPVVVLVGCGDSKYDGLLPAGGKYRSGFFTVKRRYSEAVGDYWVVVSAKHYVVEPHEWIDDYDKSVKKMSPSERALWGEITGTNLISYLCDIEAYDAYPSEVHLLLGQDYKEPISDELRFLREESDVTVVDRFEGTSGMGEQMSKLNAIVEEHTA